MRAKEMHTAKRLKIEGDMSVLAKFLLHAETGVEHIRGGNSGSELHQTWQRCLTGYIRIGVGGIWEEYELLDPPTVQQRTFKSGFGQPLIKNTRSGAYDGFRAWGERNRGPRCGSVSKWMLRRD